jgi:hypothetical protein
METWRSLTCGTCLFVALFGEVEYLHTKGKKIEAQVKLVFLVNDGPPLGQWSYKIPI